MLDDYIRRVIDSNINMLVPHYLMHSYLYYSEGDTVIIDEFYDEICKRLDKNLTEVRHEHKYLIRKSMLAAGTGYYLRNLPSRIIGAALTLRDMDRQQTKPITRLRLVRPTRTTP